MDRSDWLKRLFANIDARDADGFLSFLADDVVFRFGNAEPASGKAVVGEVVRGFLASIASLSHEIVAIWTPARQRYLPRHGDLYERRFEHHHRPFRCRPHA